MPKQKYAVVVAGTLMMLMMGGIAYTWSIYVAPLMQQFGWTKAQTSMPFSIFLMSYTVGMILGGRLQDQFGPRMVCTIGAVLFGGGYLLSGFASSFIQLCVVYGVMTGIGVGFAYVTPMASVVKWFPNRKGLMGGIVVFGFGGGAFLFAPLVEWIITEYRWQDAFIYVGIGCTVLGVIASRFIRLPEQASPSPVPSAMTEPATPVIEELSPGQAVRRPIFWIAWGAWVLVMIVGLGLLGHMKDFATGLGVEEVAAAFLISVVAITNGAGRIIMGGMSDIIGRARSLAAACFVMIPVAAGLAYVGPNLAMLYALGAVFGLCFGTWLVLYPMLTSDLFGNKHLGMNYGLLFSSYGIGGFVGPLLYGKINDATGSYQLMMLIAMGMCVVAGMLAIGVHVVDRKANATSAEPASSP